MLKQIKINDNLISYKGNINYTSIENEYIEHEGKTFTHTNRISKTTSVEKLKKEKPTDFYKREYDFKLLNYKLEIEDNSTFYRSFAEMTNLKYSENDSVNAIITAFENGFLDNRIKNVFTAKGHEMYYPMNYRTMFKLILETLAISIPLYGYGFNNFVYYDIHIKTLFEVKLDERHRNIVQMFNEHGIKLSQGATLKNVSKIMNLKLQYT